MPNHRIDLSVRQLEAIVAVAEHGGFRAAAQALAVSQPALTRTVQLAEQSVRTRVFDRTQQGAELTPAGLALLPIARRILAEFSASRSELADFVHGRTGRVTIAVLPSIGVAVMPPMLARFQAEHPGIRFGLPGLSAGALQDAVAEGTADLGISIQPQAGSGFLFEPLFKDPFLLLCRHDDPAAEKRSVPWSMFTDRPFVATALLSSIRTMTDAVFAERDLVVEPRFESGNVTMTAALVEAGLGVTALPRLALSLINQSGLTTVPLTEPVVTRQVGIVTRTGRSLSTVAEQVRGALLDGLRAPA